MAHADDGVEAIVRDALLCAHVKQLQTSGQVCEVSVRSVNQRTEASDCT